MGTNTQQKQIGEKSLAQGSPDKSPPIEDQLRELYGRVAYSHKTHIIQASLELQTQSHVNLAEISLSAITTTGLIFVLLGTGTWGVALATLASTALLGLILYTKDYDLGKIAEQHKRSADELWHIRERYLSLLTDLKGKDSDDDSIKTARDNILEELNAIYSAAPVTSPKAYSKAQAALKLKEDLTFSDDELDYLLPAALRKMNLN